MQEIIINQDENENKIIALVENGKLVEKYEERAEQNRIEGNIYLGKVENVLIGMQAAFIDIGIGKNTFIHIKDVIPKASSETGNKNELLSKHDIKNYIKTGMPILIQVKRDITDKKGARVSTNLSLTGRFVVLMPKSKFVTVSKKIEDEEERIRLLEIAKKVLPQEYGIIIRTSAQGKDKEIIENDIKEIIKKYLEIQEKAKKIEKSPNWKPSLIYKNDGVIGKLLIDMVDQDLRRIVTNNENIFKYINQFLEDVNLKEKVKLELRQKEDVLKIYDIQEQIEKANNRKIWLKCGGFITIDKTEALTAIDVNSGKYIGKHSLEQTVFTVNKDATIEIAKQLRLKDIGGIVIIDYIDMEKEENKQKIVEILQENLKKDRSKTQIIGFTPLNLLEMTRKHMWGEGS